MGIYSPPEPGGSTRAAAVAASSGGTAGGDPLVLAAGPCRSTKPSCNEEEVPMASYTIEIPDGLHHEIQERRHQIDVADICTQALDAAVAVQQTEGPSVRARDTRSPKRFNRMFSG